jgi:hypothetical protein
MLKIQDTINKLSSNILSVDFDKIPIKTEEKEKELEKKYDSLIDYASLNPTSLKQIYDKTILGISHNNLDSLSSNELSKVPLLLFSDYNNPVDLSDNNNFMALYRNWFTGATEKSKRDALTNLWFVLIFHYPYKNFNFMKWASFFRVESQRVNSSSIKTLNEIDKKYEMLSPSLTGPKLCAIDILSTLDFKEPFKNRKINNILLMGEFAIQSYLQCFDRIYYKGNTNYITDSIDDELALLREGTDFLGLIKENDEKSGTLINLFLNPFITNPKNFLKFKKSSKLFLKETFNDVRVKNETHWLYVRTQLKDLFKTWLAEDDLYFFFDLFEQTDHWIERRNFWQQYLRLNKISESWPLLNYNKLKELTPIHYKNYNFGRLKETSETQSAILFRIGILVIVEITDSGACFIYPEDHPSCPQFGKYDDYYLSELRYSDAYTVKYVEDIKIPIGRLKDGIVLRFIHTKNHWQKSIANVIRAFTGIRLKKYG